MARTFVIGDVHGHFDRLEALLLQEGIIGRCSTCQGRGDTYHLGAEPDGSTDEVVICEICDGDGLRRIDHDTFVVQLGDLAHLGGATGSPTGDQICYLYADRWLDLVLWGNHERALVDWQHGFSGYEYPGIHIEKKIEYLRKIGKMKVAAAAHGYLIVHAGVSSAFSNIAFDQGDAYNFAAHLNDLGDRKLDWLKDNPPRFSEIKNGQNLRVEAAQFSIIDDISFLRAGPAADGGVLWFDWDREPHLDGVPFKFICGHTAQYQDGEPKEDEYGNWNIDIGGKYEARLCGLWLEDDKDPRPVKVEL